MTDEQFKRIDLLLSTIESTIKEQNSLLKAIASSCYLSRTDLHILKDTVETINSELPSLEYFENLDEWIKDIHSCCDDGCYFNVYDVK